MSVPFLERLIRLMADNGLTDLQLKDGDQRIILSRGGAFAGGRILLGANVQGRYNPKVKQSFR